VGAAVRIGDAMLGLATVESTRLACEGTAAATLRNMMAVGVSGVLWYSVLLLIGFGGIGGYDERWCKCEGGVVVMMLNRVNAEPCSPSFCRLLQKCQEPPHLGRT
jgi:hypothetical protein